MANEIIFRIEGERLPNKDFSKYIKQQGGTKVGYNSQFQITTYHFKNTTIEASKLHNEIPSKNLVSVRVVASNEDTLNSIVNELQGQFSNLTRLEGNGIL